MIRAVLLLLGLTVVSSAVVADTRGWLATRPTMIGNVPRSIRDNPAAYRSLYGGSPNLFGGK
jgi:hypothetical protein